MTPLTAQGKAPAAAGKLLGKIWMCSSNMLREKTCILDGGFGTKMQLPKICQIYKDWHIGSVSCDNWFINATIFCKFIHWKFKRCLRFVEASAFDDMI